MEMFFSGAFVILFDVLKSLGATLLLLLSAPIALLVLGFLVLSGRSLDEAKNQVAQARREAEDKAVKSEKEFVEFVNKVDRTEMLRDEEESKAKEA